MWVASSQKKTKKPVLLPWYSTVAVISTTGGSKNWPGGSPSRFGILGKGGEQQGKSGIDPTAAELTEKVVGVTRVAKVVKGGRRFSFSALVVVGDETAGSAAALARASEVPEAIRKGIEDAKKNLIRFP